MATGTRISHPRILRAPHDQPLTLEQIKTCAPAIFQTTAYHKMSERYAYIPSITLLQAMLSEGFTIHEVAQHRPYKGDRDPYAKHMVRMRMPTKAKRVGEVIPELVFINAHDGTARYYLYGGLYRLICSNGMMAGETFTKLVVAHRVGGLVDLVMENSLKMVGEFPKLIKAYESMRAITINRDAQMLLATSALELRYGSVTPPFGPEALLNCRRPQDEEPTLWNIFNRVQENAIDGGFGSTSFLFQRKITVRPIERVDVRVRINRGLWDVAMGMVQ